MKTQQICSGGLLAMVVAAASAAVAISQPMGAISGTVSDSTSGTPLVGVKITLNYGVGSATTDTTGGFLLDNLKPGGYSLKAEKEGFAQFATSLRLAEGEKVAGYALRLSPEAVISGRILNAKGEQVNAFVTLSGVESQAHVAFAVAEAGVFRIGSLAAGAYKLSARAAGAGGGAELVETYYPSETLRKHASTIILKQGERKSGLDIVLREVRFVTIRGRYSGDVPGGWQSFVMLQNLTGGSLGVRGGGGFLDPESRFTLQAPPGEYRLKVIAKQQSPEQPVVLGFLDLRVTDSGVNDVVIPASSIRSIRGKFRWAEDSSESSRKHTLEGSFSLNPMEGLGILQHGKRDADGWVVAPRVSPDRYSILLNDLPEGAYVRSIVAGGRAITERGLDLISGVSTELEFVIADDGGVVTGRVVDAAQRPVQGGRISIMRATTHRPELELWSTQTSGDARGEFSETGIAPGEYTITARADGKTSPTKTIRVVAGGRQHVQCELP